MVAKFHIYIFLFFKLSDIYPSEVPLSLAGDDTIDSRKVGSSSKPRVESACAIQLELLRLSLSLILLTTLFSSCTGAVSAEFPEPAGDVLLF